MRTFEVIMKIDVNDDTEAVKVTSNLPGEGDASIIALHLKKLADGLVLKIGAKLNRDYPKANKEERLEILKNLTIKDLEK